MNFNCKCAADNIIHQFHTSFIINSYLNNFTFKLFAILNFSVNFFTNTYKLPKVSNAELNFSLYMNSFSNKNSHCQSTVTNKTLHFIGTMCFWCSINIEIVSSVVCKPIVIHSRYITENLWNDFVWESRNVCSYIEICTKNSTTATTSCWETWFFICEMENSMWENSTQQPIQQHTFVFLDVIFLVQYVHDGLTVCVIFICIKCDNRHRENNVKNNTKINIDVFIVYHWINYLDIIKKNYTYNKLLYLLQNAGYHCV